MLLLFSFAVYSSWTSVINGVSRSANLVVFITDNTEEGQREKREFLNAAKGTSIEEKITVLDEWTLFEIDGYLDSLKTDGSVVVVVGHFKRDKNGQLVEIGDSRNYLRKFAVPIYLADGTRLQRRYPLFGGW